GWADALSARRKISRFGCVTNARPPARSGPRSAICANRNLRQGRGPTTAADPLCYLEGMDTEPRFILTLAAAEHGKLHWPIRSVHEVSNYYERVAADAEMAPDGDCPATGELVYKKDRIVLLVWMALVDAVIDLNKSGRAMAAFLSFPSRGPVKV